MNRLVKIPLYVCCILGLFCMNAYASNECERLVKSENYEEAISVCKEACNQDNGISCRFLGQLYHLGYGEKQSYPKESSAYDYYKKACKLNDGFGCIGSGMLAYDYGEAKRYYEKACRLNDNDGIGCRNLGLSYYNGEGVRRNYSTAKNYFEKACNLNDGHGCTLLGILYHGGQGVRQDYSTAIKYYEKACRMNESLGCFGLGIVYQSGQGVRQNTIKAKEYFGKTCDLGEQKGCDEYRKLKEQGY